MTIAASYFLYFLIYSFLGWLVEVVKVLLESRKFVNRGFLLGPICPIYGVGVLGILLVVAGSSGWLVNGALEPSLVGSDVVGVFLKTMVLRGALEYLTSYILEKLFNVRWWDYHHYKFNINGRICLETMTLFGLAGVAVIYVIQPLVAWLVGLLPTVVLMVLAIGLLLIFIADMVFSILIMHKIKNRIAQTRESTNDDTEEVRREVVRWLKENSTLYRHIVKAYPDFKVNWRETQKTIERKVRKQQRKVKKRLAPQQQKHKAQKRREND